MVEVFQYIFNVYLYVVNSFNCIMFVVFLIICNVICKYFDLIFNFYFLLHAYHLVSNQNQKFQEALTCTG